MSNELYPENKQKKFPFLVQQSQTLTLKCIWIWILILTNTVISDALSIGQPNYLKKFTLKEGHHLPNLSHHLNLIDCHFWNIAARCSPVRFTGS